jgi:hypothetical protein
MQIGGLTAKGFNKLADRWAHIRQGCYCPGCGELSSDFKPLLIDCEIWHGGCRKCSAQQTKRVRGFMNCEDLLDPVAK